MRKIFLDGSGRRSYFEGTRLTHIEACYKFDCELKAAVLSRIQRIEQHSNTLTVHYFAKKYQTCDNSDFYLDTDNYFQGKGYEIIGLLRENNPNKVEFHDYEKEHEGLPLWMCADSFSFGLTSKMYAALERDIQRQICAEFLGMFSTEEFGEILNVLNAFRNICAHNGRKLFDGEEVNKSLSEDEVFKQNASIMKWAIDEVDGKYNFYALMIILSLLLEFDDWCALTKETNKLLSKLKEELSQIPQAYGELKKRMGLKGESGQWGKKILNELTRRIKYSKAWYQETPIDTRKSEETAAGETVEEEKEELQEEIQRWMCKEWKSKEYNEKMREHSLVKTGKRKKKRQ